MMIGVKPAGEVGSAYWRSMMVVVAIEERARLRACAHVMAHACAHGVLVKGGARRCVADACLMGMSVFRSCQYLLKQKTEKQPYA